MAHHAEARLPEGATRRLGTRAWPLYRTGFVVGTAALLAAIGTAFAIEGWRFGFGDGWTAMAFRRFGLAYVVAFAFVLSLALGALFFVLIQHLTRAGASVLVRRVAEVYAAAMPTVATMFVPILAVVLLTSFGVLDRGVVYPWAQPMETLEAAGHAAHGEAAEPEAAPAGEHAGEPLGEEPFEGESTHTQIVGFTGAPDPAELLHAVEVKRGWLNGPAFALRWAVYFAVWCAAGLWYWQQSVRQDETGEPGLTVRMERLSPVAVLAFAVTLTFAAFDLLMSLDPKWYSTIFGVYYFSGAFLGAVSTMILSIVGLKRLGMLKVVDEDHLHDLGKWLFAFVFFWGYIAFSQYMLIWYANLPETTYWFDLRGMTTVPERITGWTGVALALLIGHLLIPFAGLLSRHVKRRGGLLALWAAWLLVFHWLDLYWVVMPLYSRAWLVPIVEVLAVIGLAGLYFGAVVHRAADHSLVPAKDPRMGESLSFENV